jgi:hypothetical protein
LVFFASGVFLLVAQHDSLMRVMGGLWGVIGLGWIRLAVVRLRGVEG